MKYFQGLMDYFTGCHGLNRIYSRMFILIWLMQRCLGVDITYAVNEGTSSGTYIGNIAADSEIARSHNNMNLITYSQLQQSNSESPNLFRVAKKTGKLYTLETLDAEVICKRNKECFQILDVAIQERSSTVKILEIKVIIKDVNDHQPEFPNEQIGIEFEENYIQGTKVLIPNALIKT